MRALGIVLGLFFMGLISVGAQTSSPTEAAVQTPPVGKFQLLAAVVDGPRGEPRKIVLLLDTQSGDVWEYEPGFASPKSDGGSKWTPSDFVPLEKMLHSLGYPVGKPTPSVP
jgi:hypothetical protein